MDSRHSEPSPLESLPVELVRLILSALPDVISLQTAILSSPTFYRPFVGAQSAITSYVLLRQIDATVLPDAVLAVSASRFQACDETDRLELVREFSRKSLGDKAMLPKTWPLQEAVAIAKLHVYVDGFAHKFAAATLTEPPFAPAESAPMPTQQESLRIHRALYRFETYRHLFRVAPDALRLDSLQLFFRHYSTFENEQLACIHDFFARAVLSCQLSQSNRLRNYLTKLTRDGTALIGKVSDGTFETTINSPLVQNLLLLGLEGLHNAIYRVPGNPFADLPPGADLFRPQSFLYAGLCYANDSEIHITLNEMSPQLQELHIRKPFFADPDSGPLEAWKWAYLEEMGMEFVFNRARRSLRRWGYVLWDRWRLDDIGVLEEPFEPW